MCYLFGITREENRHGDIKHIRGFYDKRQEDGTGLRQGHGDVGENTASKEDSGFQNSRISGGNQEDRQEDKKSSNRKEGMTGWLSTEGKFE